MFISEQLCKGSERGVNMNTNNERFLIKVVDMYYKDELSQEEIAKKLNVSRTTVSRTLTRAKNEGYVKIVINYPSESPIDFEKAIEQKYGLKEALIAMAEDEKLSDFLVASEASDYLIRVLKSNMILGITWGKTMKKVIDNFASELSSVRISVKGVEVVPFLGTTTMDRTDEEYRLTYSNILATKVGELIHGISYNLSAPMFVSNEEVKKIIESEHEVSKVLHIAKKSDIALFGIGELSNESSIASVGVVKMEELQELEKRGGVGEIVGRIYDADGNTMDVDLNRKVIGISLEDMKKIPTRVGIAYGINKVKAIKAALKGGIVNVLITDKITAQYLMKDEDNN